MQKTLIIARRELSSLFFSPVAYVALIVFSLIGGLLFYFLFIPGAPAELRYEFRYVMFLLAFIVPAISMGLLAEEQRTGTAELLMTAPVNDVHIVVGKWLGAMGFFLALLTPLVVHVVILELTASPDYGPIFTGFVGLLLVGGLYLAIGLAFSGATRSQFIALILTILATGFLTIGLALLSAAAWVPPWLRSAMYYINVDQQFDGFSKGLIDTSNFVFFLSMTALFLFFAVLLLQSRRWR